MIRISMVMLLLAASGSAASTSFQQGGWSDGGPLVVSFTGLDNNLDGVLLVDELTQFRAIWRTPEGSLTKWGLPEIEPDGFFFADLGNFVFFIRNADYSLVDTAFGGEFLATVFDSQLFPVDSTAGPAEVVPEPGTFGLMGAVGLAMLICRARLRSKVGASRCRN